MESYEILWKTTLPELEKTVTSISYETFITTLTPVDIVGNKLVLLAQGKILADTVGRNPLAKNIKEALKKSNREIDDFVVYDAKSREEYLAMVRDSDEDATAHGSPINPKFTFESFVVGPSNEFIYAAAKAVADHPGESYNPLFIYGGTGLGKTHILMAIANHIRRQNPSLKVLYSTCEQFTNQMVESLSKGKLTPEGFRKTFRGVDILLIDDVQFLSKKTQTQTEFFHTFNELIMQNKQVVLASDRPPKEIEVLEDRLRSRFEGGLLADVQPPDLETRIAILRKKSEEQKCLVDMRVLAYIAEGGDEDIRSLIGKLTKVILASKLHEKPITVELVKEALKESTGGNVEELQMDDIINCVCNFYKISKADMLGKKRNKEFVEPRQVCVYLITDMLSGIPLITVGEQMGGRDHSTMVYTRDKIAEEIKVNRRLATEINDIKKMLLKE